jgi:hypothetical protein
MVSQVLSIKRAGSKIFSDERILGSSDFAKNAIRDAEEREKETLRLNSNTDLVTSKIFDIQNTLEIQLFQTKKRALRTQLDTLDFQADRNFG